MLPATTDAHLLLDRLQIYASQIVDLARYVALAVRIEPALLRSARLKFMPGSDPGLEADLWFSPLVQARSPQGLVLLADVADVLRRQLDSAPGGLLDQVWAWLAAAHANAPPALQLEERVGYLALTGRPGATAEIEQLLQQVVVAMTQPARRSGLATWAARALPRLPAEVQATDAFAVLNWGTGVYVSNSSLVDAPLPRPEVRAWLEKILPALPSTEVGIRLLDHAVVFADPDPTDPLVQPLEVPATNPVILEVSWTANPPQPSALVQWVPGHTEGIPTGSGPLTIRTLLGVQFTLQAQAPTGTMEPRTDTPANGSPLEDANSDHEGGNPTGDMRALLIGVDAYNFVNSLSGCVNDILAIHRFLVNNAGIPHEQVALLLAPGRDAQIGSDVGAFDQPTKNNIMSAFKILAEQTAANDQVVIYYAGHGVQITNPQNPREHIGAIVPVDAQVNGTNFVINRELNEGIQRVVGAGAQVTVILDSCHSGGPTRDLTMDPSAPAVREIILDPQKLDWAAFQREHNLDGNSTDGGSTRGFTGGSGWVPSIAQGQELIVLSACRDIQTAYEFTPPGTNERHGALTYFFLDALKTTDPERATQVRWQDIYPSIRANIQSFFPDQTPTLEGRGERPLFGGAWQPYAPGFTVSVNPGGTMLTLDGGAIHGLGPGAQVAIYPPNTANFNQATQVAVATVVNATPVTSQARIDGTPSGSVANGARAILTRPSTATPRITVELIDVPEAIMAGIRSVPQADEFMDLTPGNQAPVVTVRPRAIIDGKDGWVLVKYTSNEKALTANDVIAYAPRNPEGLRIDPEKLGEAIGEGLVHWARYWSVVTRHNDEPRLQGTVTLRVLVGDDDNALRQAGAQPGGPVRAPDAAGQVAVGQDEVLLLKVDAAPSSPVPLNVVIMLCSDDGNIELLWPPENAENVLPPGEERSVGVNGPNPFQLTIRDDQQASRYVLKLFASDQGHPFATNSLQLEGTVQDHIDGGLRGGFVPTLPPILWTAVDVPVLVQRRRIGP